MRTIAIQFVILQILLCLTSCEKDFVYDQDCKPGGGQIGEWEDPADTTIVEKKDTTKGSFYIEVNEWGDTIRKDIPI